MQRFLAYIRLPLAEIDGLIGSLPEKREGRLTGRMLIGILASLFFHGFTFTLFLIPPLYLLLFTHGTLFALGAFMLAAFVFWLLVSSCVYTTLLEVDIEEHRVEIIAGVVINIVQPALRGVPVLIQCKDKLVWVHMSKTNALRIKNLEGEIGIVGKMYSLSKLVFQIDGITAQNKQPIKAGKLANITVKS